MRPEDSEGPTADPARGRAPKRIVTFTTLYPNEAQPHLGLFVEHRLRRLVATGEVASKVIAPVPWFPFTGSIFGRYGTFARAPQREQRHGIEIRHPRYPRIPKVGMTVAPLLMARAVKRTFRRLVAEGYDFDAVDAHYLYPDGVAAALIGRWLGRPVVITARGTDVNLIPEFRIPRKQILWAARHSAAIVTVCQALKDELVRMGVPANHITVLRNGVDLNMFRPMDREEARRVVGFQAPTLLSVGALIERKGHHIAIEALQQLPGVYLMIVGEGEMEPRLRQLADQLGVSDRVGFAGNVPQEKLPCYYSAADALVLASSREGMANVLLEALACGTPVIATANWGTPEVISEPTAGVLMKRRDAVSLAEAYRNLGAHHPEQQSIRRFAQKFSWDETTRGQVVLFQRVSNHRSERRRS